uniref:Ribosome biogenesis protein NOP53 n=1 Tax=Parascaris univalens TaxID=6257 RepID=A0A915BBH5_PARUN
WDHFYRSYFRKEVYSVKEREVSPSPIMESSLISTMGAETPKLNARKCPRRKKRYWRKATRGEEFLTDEQINQENDVLRGRIDSELFTIDRTPQLSSMRLTRKQIAALNKRNLLERADDEEKEIKPSKSILKEMFRKKKKVIATALRRRDPVVMASGSKVAYDLWADESKETSTEHALIEDHYLRSTKRKKPLEPRTLKHIPSLLPPVEVAEAGASYNPSISTYQKYVDDIAKDEVKVEEDEGKLQKALSLAPGETYVSQSDIIAEESEGLFNETATADAELTMDHSDLPSNEENKKPIAKKEKTSKMRRLEMLEKRKKFIEKAEREAKRSEQLVFKVKKLNKEISKSLLDIENKTKLRRKRKSAKRLLGTQRLGRGKFTPEERPFLLSEELPGSLRQLKPQGDVIADRLKSLQKRNMIAIPGEERVRSKLKKKLRVKISERRSYKEVTIGSRVI